MKTLENLKKIRGMKEADISAQILAKRKELNLLSLNVKAGKSDKFSDIAKIRKYIAQLETVLKEKEYSDGK